MSDFSSETEPYRRDLLAHCYRMLGSVHDAEDVVQETYLRAWRSYDRFEGRSSVRTWLYRIATNACLTALQRRGHRSLPSGLGSPSDDPHAAPDVATDPGWLEPIPDSLVIGESDDPAAVAVMRESLRLALIAGLQYLPAKQRAVLILRDVLAFPAAEVAAMLDTTTAAVKSLLQRARGRMHQVRSQEVEQAGEPTDPTARALLDQYIAGFENADLNALEQALRKDAVLEMVGSRTWFSGVATCLRFIEAQAVGTAGDWRMMPTVANGQPAAAAYLRGEAGVHRGFGFAVLTTTNSGIARIAVFGDPTVLATGGFPPTLPPS